MTESSQVTIEISSDVLSHRVTGCDTTSANCWKVGPADPKPLEPELAYDLTLNPKPNNPKP